MAEANRDAVPKEEDASEELEEGIRAASAPIRNIDGNVMAALSVVGPTNRIPPHRMQEIVEALVETADTVSAHVLRS